MSSVSNLLSIIDLNMVKNEFLEFDIQISVARRYRMVIKYHSGLIDKISSLLSYK